MTDQKIDLFSAKFKSLQGLYLQEVKDYFDSTKTNHYSSSSGRLDAKNPLGDKIEAIDVIDSLGFLKEFTLSNVIKYVMRFGHKDGYNKKDIYKAIQYLIWLVIYIEHHYVPPSNEDSIS